MLGKLCLFIGQEYLQVRFEVRGERRFKSLLNLFHETFPLAVWNRQQRVWILPIAQKDDVKLFALKYLGAAGLVIQDEENLVSALTSQMSLF